MYRCKWCGSVYRCDEGICGNCKLLCPSVEQMKEGDYCLVCEQWKDQIPAIEEAIILHYQEKKNSYYRPQKLLKKKEKEDD